MHVLSHDELLDKLIARLDAGDLRPKQVASALGVPSPRVAELRKRKRRIQPHEMSIVAALLLSDEAPPDCQQLVRAVPLYASFSSAICASDNKEPIDLVPVMACDADERTFAVRLEPFAIDKILPEGGWAAIDPDRLELFAGRIYAVKRERFPIMLMRFEVEPARMIPVPSVYANELLFLNRGDFVVLGTVVALGVAMPRCRDECADEYEDDTPF